MLLHRGVLAILIIIVVAYFNGVDGLIGSVFRKQAFQAAKRVNNIPRSAQPVKTHKVPDRGSNKGKDLRVYDYINNNGQRISIRQDLPRKYGGNGHGDQGPHYNAGPSEGKLKQHHNFDKYNSKRG